MHAGPAHAKAQCNVLHAARGLSILLGCQRLPSPGWCNSSCSSYYFNHFAFCTKHAIHVLEASAECSCIGGIMQSLHMSEHLSEHRSEHLQHSLILLCCAKSSEQLCSKTSMMHLVARTHMSFMCAFLTTSPMRVVSSLHATVRWACVFTCVSVSHLLLTTQIWDTILRLLLSHSLYAVHMYMLCYICYTCSSAQLTARCASGIVMMLCRHYVFWHAAQHSRWSVCSG